MTRRLASDWLILEPGFFGDGRGDPTEIKVIPIPRHGNPGKEKVIIIPRRELVARKQSKIFVAKVLPGSVSPHSCSPN